MIDLLPPGDRAIAKIIGITLAVIGVVLIILAFVLGAALVSLGVYSISFCSLLLFPVLTLLLVSFVFVQLSVWLFCLSNQSFVTIQSLYLKVNYFISPLMEIPLPYVNCKFRYIGYYLFHLSMLDFFTLNLPSTKTGSSIPQLHFFVGFILIYRD